MQKFELGKSYVYKFTVKYKYEVLYADDEGALLKFGPAPFQRGWFPHSRIKDFTEYKEPIVHERWVWWIKYPDRVGTQITARETRTDGNPFEWSGEVLKKEKITFTERF